MIRGETLARDCVRRGRTGAVGHDGSCCETLKSLAVGCTSSCIKSQGGREARNRTAVGRRFSHCWVLYRSGCPPVMGYPMTTILPAKTESGAGTKKPRVDGRGYRLLEVSSLRQQCSGSRMRCHAAFSDVIRWSSASRLCKFTGNGQPSTSKNRSSACFGPSPPF